MDDTTRLTCWNCVEDGGTSQLAEVCLPGELRQTLICGHWKQGCPGCNDALLRRVLRQCCHATTQLHNDWTTIVFQFPRQF
eukprot:9441871-Pyramimonas_sp.AAC.1